MKTTLSLTIVALLTAGALAQNEDRAFLDRFEQGFEPEGGVAAADFVPEGLMTGNLHTVRPLAHNDGLNNTYFVDTPSGLQEITGTPALVARIREVYAIEYLRGLSKSEEFRKALGQAAGAKVKSAAGLVRNPVSTIKDVPRGASRFFGRIGEGLKGGQSEGERGRPLSGITGTAAAKAKLAAQLGVNPYSTNEELQGELTSVAQATAAGGLVVNAATSVATGGAGAALTVVGANEMLQDTLTNSTPEDLRIINRKKLFALGIDRTLADEFLMHPWFSPWHETITTDALAQIGLNPAPFLSTAVRALTPEDAFFFQRVAQILARYHTTKAPLRSIRLEGGVICALDRDGVLVVPLSCDEAIWAERSARRARSGAARSSAPRLRHRRARRATRRTST
jgi:hypothetical protein